MKVDLEGYQKQKEEEGEHFYRDANSLAFGSTGFRESLSPVLIQHLCFAAPDCGDTMRWDKEWPLAFLGPRRKASPSPSG
jgi:hypothetical protein